MNELCSYSGASTKRKRSKWSAKKLKNKFKNDTIKSQIWCHSNKINLESILARQDGDEHDFFTKHYHKSDSNEEYAASLQGCFHHHDELYNHHQISQICNFAAVRGLNWTLIQSINLLPASSKQICFTSLSLPLCYSVVPFLSHTTTASSSKRASLIKASAAAAAGGSSPYLIDALIFDCDGVIVESEDIHRRAYNAAFENFNVVCPGESATIDWTVEYYDMLQNKVGGGKPKMRWYFGQKGWPTSSVLDGRTAETEEEKTMLVDVLQAWKTEKYKYIIGTLIDWCCCCEKIDDDLVKKFWSPKFSVHELNLCVLHAWWPFIIINDLNGIIIIIIIIFPSLNFK